MKSAFTTLAAALALSLAAAGASFAQSDGQMSSGAMTSHDAMSSGAMTSHDAMSNDAMSTGAMAPTAAMSTAVMTHNRYALPARKHMKHHATTAMTTPTTHRIG